MTVRRGTKEFNRALDAAIKIRSFSSYAGFVVGRELKEDNSDALMNSRAYLRDRVLQFRSAKLIRAKDGSYVLFTQGNEWYEFEIAAPNTGN